MHESETDKSGSDFEQMFVGLGARRIKNLFDQAKKNSPCVIFMDEIDAVGGTRVDTHAFYRLTINELLTQMDGFSSNSRVLVIGNYIKCFDFKLFGLDNLSLCVGICF